MGSTRTPSAGTMPLVHGPREARMDKFLHRHNLENFRKQLSEAKDDAQRQTLLQAAGGRGGQGHSHPHRAPRERLIFVERQPELVAGAPKKKPRRGRGLSVPTAWDRQPHGRQGFTSECPNCGRARHAEASSPHRTGSPADPARAAGAPHLQRLEGRSVYTARVSRRARKPQITRTISAPTTAPTSPAPSPA